MGILFARERADDNWDEALAMMQMHHEAISSFGDLKLDPSREFFKHLEDIGAVRTYIAREDGYLIGYAVFFVAPSPHYRDLLQATQTALFIRPDKRGFGSRFIDWCDAELKKDGVGAVFHYVSDKHDFSRALTRIGYRKIESVYLRRM